MKRSCAAALCVMAVALAAPAAGCGDDDSEQFRQDYNAAVERLSTINDDIGSATGGAGGRSNDAIAREFDKIADTAEQTRSDLADLDPPEDAKDEYDALLSALGKGVDDLRSVADAAKSNNPVEANKAARRLGRTVQEISRAEDALKQAVDG
jgi:methyl-accepting chemotaxis protein